MSKPANYANCCFYRLVCRDVNVKECYNGHTVDAAVRLSHHKSSCNNKKSTAHNYLVYRFIREHGGFDNWQMLIHEKSPMADFDAASMRERFWLEHYGATLNANTPSATHEEHLAQQKEYYIKHRVEILAKQNEYNAEHKAQIKKYRLENKDKIREARAKYNMENSAHINKKHDCACCGGRYTTQNISYHVKTKKHIAALAAK